ncbi:hypothetical protein UFOVP1616_29 [uncultured Caudovirales phage]|uniref:Uncharacterized protein n=1 Tax=uncultured Caudovirales phage TaxID=2100421 RepID=A0A6J5SK75_9CAUD|nr:hypothetical protein UFOVP1467_45 [uncultured Caudovirales phage]CAB4219648.1 hypothetical protein UFOVP1616_29 [uncultured Caudovirales phage]
MNIRPIRPYSPLFAPASRGECGKVIPPIFAPIRPSELQFGRVVGSLRVAGYSPLPMSLRGELQGRRGLDEREARHRAVLGIFAPFAPIRPSIRPCSPLNPCYTRREYSPLPPLSIRQGGAGATSPEALEGRGLDRC